MDAVGNGWQQIVTDASCRSIAGMPPTVLNLVWGPPACWMMMAKD